MFYLLTNKDTKKQYLVSEVKEIHSKMNLDSEPVALPSFDQLKLSTMTMGDVAENIYGDMTFDCAIPFHWLDDASKGDADRYNILRANVVWLYIEGDAIGQPAPLCIEAKQIIDELRAA